MDEQIPYINNVTNTSCPAPANECNRIQFLSYMFVFVPVGLTGIVLNSFTLAVLNLKPLQAPDSVVAMIHALAVSDLITCILMTPIAFCRCINGSVVWNTTIRVIYEIYIYLPLANTFANLSLWLVVIISLERCIVLLFPAFHRQYWDVKTVHKTVITTFFCAFIINLPVYFAWKYDGNTAVLTDFGRSNAYLIYSYVRMMIVKILPVISILLISLLSIYAIHRFQRRESNIVQPMSHNSERRNRLKVRYSTMVICIALVSLVAHSLEPFLHSQIYSAVINACPFTTLHYSLMAMSNCLEIISYACNFLIYFAFNKQFRWKFSQLWTCKCQTGNSNGEKDNAIIIIKVNRVSPEVT